MDYQYNQDLNFPKGFYTDSKSLGIKKNGKLDSAILYSSCPANWAGVFTTNNFRSYSLEDAVLKARNKVQVLSVFSGNANTCTGLKGKKSVEEISKAIAEQLAIGSKQVLLSFTGVIGIPFPTESIVEQIKTKDYYSAFKHSFGQEKNSGKPTNPFFKGILTTDTRPKKIALTLKLKKGIIRIAACAKGAGMIAPNMATMLAYMTTDLKMSNAECKRLIKLSLPQSFNSISVDGDTSTNDSCFLIANGQSNLSYREFSSAEKNKVDLAISSMYEYLAKEIVRDGEGATKLITVKVSGAKSNKIAYTLGRCVANSLLVKTAVFGNDPNYGRILMAIGNSGLPIDLKDITLKFGQVLLYSNETLNLNRLSLAANYLKNNNEILIDIKVGSGKGEQVFYTCDISYDYVKINAEYTT